MNKEKFNWTFYNDLCENLVEKVQNEELPFTDIITVPRGGFIPAQRLAYSLSIPRIYSLGVSFYEDAPGVKRKAPHVYQYITIEQKDLSDRVILIVDDIIDSGDTTEYIKYHLKYSNNQFNEFPNALDFDADWKSSNFYANLECDYESYVYNSKLGIGFDRFRLDTSYQLANDFYDVGKIYGTLDYSLGNEIQGGLSQGG